MQVVAPKLSLSTMVSLLEQVKPKLRPFQREALEFATKGKRYGRQLSKESLKSSNKTAEVVVDRSVLGTGRILLADEMGLGKSLTSLAIMAYYESDWPLLILCPASLRYTWPAEIEKFFPTIEPNSIYVANGFADTAFTKRTDVKIVVVTYSLLQKRSAVAHALTEANYRCIIADESHNLKQKDSQRSQLILPVLKRAQRLVLLSGTPALARPSELWTQLSCLSPKTFGNWKAFAQRYCAPQRKNIGGRFIMDYSGSSHEAELHGKLASVMVRRLKSDVLSELPPKQRAIVPTPITGEAKTECQQAMADLSTGRSSVESLFSDQQADERTLLMRAYQTTGIGKAQAVGDFLMDWLAGSTQKILVFAHHKAVLDHLDQLLLQKAPNSHMRIDGGVPTNARAGLVQQFQTCSRVRVALLSMTAAGVGLTLTAASTVLFAELHWTPGVLAQAEDRAHRIGQQHDSVQILYMINKDSKLSLDSAMWKMLGRKIGTLDQVVDGREETPYLFEANERNNASMAQGRGLSVQDELTSFFADATVGEAAGKSTKTPAKGSIESFFLKPGSAKPSAKDKGSLGRSNSSSSRNLTKKPAAGSSETTWRSAGSAAKVGRRTWGCSNCTYLNEDADSAACEVCGHVEKVGSDVSAPGAGGSVALRQDPPLGNGTTVRWECPACTLENVQQRMALSMYYCEACSESFVEGAGSSAAKVKMAAASGHRTPQPGRVPQSKSSKSSLAHSRLSRDAAAPKPLRTNVPRPSASACIAWTCNGCRQENSSRQSAAGLYRCKSCSKSYVPDIDDSDDTDNELDDYTPVVIRRASTSTPAASLESMVSSAKQGTARRRVAQKTLSEGSSFAVEWTCSTCFLDNSAERTASNKYKCELCGDVYREPTFKTPTTTGTATRKRPVRVSMSSSVEVVVLDDEETRRRHKKPATVRVTPDLVDLCGNDEAKSPVVNVRNETATEPIEIDDSDSETEELLHSEKAGEPDKVGLSFSVSKHSQRITVHDAHAGASTAINFAIDDVVSKATADGLLDSRVKQAAMDTSKMHAVEFNAAGLKRLAQTLLATMSLGISETVIESEVRSFVAGFLRLREVEKKALGESGRAVKSNELSRSVAELVLQSATGTERYIGGAKERARENLEQGNASIQDHNVLDGRSCAWCGGDLERSARRAQSVYCSQDCAEQGRLKRGGMYASTQIRAAVFALEAGRCQLCGIDCHKLFEAVRALPPPSRLQKLLSVNWKLPSAPKALENLLHNPKEGDFWQADHIHAVAEGGGGCGLDNLRTLCVPCHKLETEKLRSRLKLKSPPKAEGAPPSKHKQSQISSFFGVSND